MRIFHIATLADWQAAQASGSYATSTRGRTLAEEGFIHASRGDQWQGVRERYYADVTEPLVLLSIDTALLQSPVVDEPVPGSDETFPHIYGPIQVGAVLTTLPLDDAEEQSPTLTSDSFSRLFLQEVFKQLVLASLVLGCVVAATLVGQASGLEWGPVSGAALGLVLGVLAARQVARRRTD
jgi:uncharacterized protein (DUF952 family)